MSLSISEAPPPTADLRLVEDEAAVAACWPLMRQLRPHLATAAELVSRWRRQAASGYRLLALWRDGRPVALAGFRVQDNLVHGVHLYVDDLVTDEAERSGGHGARLMARLVEEGRALGCSRLVLDTPLTNVLGHRFYYRNGLLATALRFAQPLSPRE
ncbi:MULTISPECIES: GNAT family N-acetyltransferase [unclassified Inquilinus]|uniref:GNAT family N-acetyltransferase n=1 Tax=unclassified Inquilinus TaxID=2645927 RepID=UPI003F908CD7